MLPSCILYEDSVDMSEFTRGRRTNSSMSNNSEIDAWDDDDDDEDDEPLDFEAIEKYWIKILELFWKNIYIN